MDIVHCSFCKHGNPADAKFCNACGSSLALQLCEACGAIDNVSATACHKCGHPFAPRSGVAAADTDAAQSLTPAAQAEESAAARRSPWKLFALLAVIVAGTLVIYPRVAGDEARLPAIDAPVEVDPEAGAKTEADLPPPHSPPADPTQAPPSEAAAETADAALPPTDAAPSPATVEPATMEPATVERATAEPTDALPTAAVPAEDTPAAPTEVTDEAQVAPPSPTEATTESAQEDTSAPTVDTSPPQAPVADTTPTSAANPQTTPAGCSPAIEALGLCNRGFR